MANETVIVYQALSNEAEIERRVSFDSLDPNQTRPFLLDDGKPRVLLPLDTVSTTVAVAPLAREGIAQATPPERGVLVPFELVAVSDETVGGWVAVSMTLVATFGPAFDTAKGQV